MSFLHKIEIAAKCSGTDSGIELLQSLPREIDIVFHYNGSKSSQPHRVIFEDHESLQNNIRYAIILINDDLSFPLDNVTSVEVIWINKHIYVHMDSDDSGYNHVLTDVRFNDRSLSVSLDTYSVCSCILHDMKYADIYVTLYTQKKSQ